MYVEQIKEEAMKNELNECKNKPPYLDEFNFPYSQMDDHIFEILLYYIFKEDIINKGEFSWKDEYQVFDDIRLMKEGSDEGRDCTLHLKGDAVGVIQCKCYGTDITKPQVAREIIKLILFYLNGNKELISDINNFTYYFVAAKDFNKEAATLINGFNKNILEENELKAWVNQVIDKYKTINCKYENIKEDLEKILKKINVNMITEVDLHRLLWTKYQHIAKLFFKLKEIFVEDIEFNEALNRIYEDINSREMSLVLKTEISQVTKEIVELYDERGEKEFTKFINSIKMPFPKLRFGVNNKIKYKENIYNLANIIIHVALMYRAFPQIELQGEVGKAIKISDDRYITYLYSEKNESYKTIILNLIKYIEGNHKYQLKGIKDIVVGSSCAKCGQASNPGAIFDINGILKQFTKADEDGDKEEFTKLRNKYEFSFHCRNCLEFEWKNSIDEVTSTLTRTIGGDYCGE